VLVLAEEDGSIDFEEDLQNLQLGVDASTGKV
jgi:hypothetical protein